MKLIDQRTADWNDRSHFFAVASRIIRRILVDHAREKRADKRGGGRAAEMRLMTIEGVPAKILLAAPNSVQEGWRPSGIPYAWSPNGKFILYDQFPGGISVFEVATGQTWPVPGAADAAPHEWGLATWSPEGHFLVINRYRTQ